MRRLSFRSRLAISSLLHEHLAAGEEHAMSSSYQRLADGLQHVSPAAGRVPEHEHVLGSLEEAAIEQRAHLPGRLCREPLRIEGREGLLKRKLRRTWGDSLARTWVLRACAPPLTSQRADEQH